MFTQEQMNEMIAQVTAQVVAQFTQATQAQDKPEKAPKKTAPKTDDLITLDDMIVVDKPDTWTEDRVLLTPVRKANARAQKYAHLDDVPSLEAAEIWLRESHHDTPTVKSPWTHDGQVYAKRLINFPVDAKRAYFVAKGAELTAIANSVDKVREAPSQARKRENKRGGTKRTKQATGRTEATIRAEIAELNAKIAVADNPVTVASLAMDIAKLAAELNTPKADRQSLDNAKTTGDETGEWIAQSAHDRRHRTMHDNAELIMEIGGDFAKIHQGAHNIINAKNMDDDKRASMMRALDVPELESFAVAIERGKMATFSERKVARRELAEAITGMYKAALKEEIDSPVCGCATYAMTNGEFTPKSHCKVAKGREQVDGKWGKETAPRQEWLANPAELTK